MSFFPFDIPGKYGVDMTGFQTVVRLPLANVGAYATLMTPTDEAACGEPWRHSKFVSGVRLAVRIAIICIIFSQHASGVCFSFNNHRSSQSCGSLASSLTNEIGRAHV